MPWPPAWACCLWTWLVVGPVTQSWFLGPAEWDWSLTLGSEGCVASLSNPKHLSWLPCSFYFSGVFLPLFICLKIPVLSQHSQGGVVDALLLFPWARVLCFFWYYQSSVNICLPAPPAGCWSSWGQKLHPPHFCLQIHSEGRQPKLHWWMCVQPWLMDQSWEWERPFLLTWESPSESEGWRSGALG